MNEVIQFLMVMLFSVFALIVMPLALVILIASQFISNGQTESTQANPAE
jgi:hypothetical protein